jgi:predicted Zn-dependent peptidase
MTSRFTLDNGIRVVSEFIPHAHSVSIGIWVASGSRHERRESNGIAHFIEHMLFKGTPTRTSLDIAREIDSVGGVLNAFTSREYVCYYAKVLHKHIDRAVDLLADIFLNSVFHPDETEKERQVILQEIRMLEDTPDDLIHDLFSRSFWEGHPLGMSILGTEDTVSGLTSETAVAYRNETYRGERIVIAVAGRAEPDQVRKLVEEHFSAVASGLPQKTEAVAGYGKHIEVVERDLEQVHLCFGVPALPHDDPRRYASFLLNSVIGGGMSSRLFQEIREKEGLAYSVYSYLSSYSDTGSMVIYAGTSHGKEEAALEIVLREFDRLRNEPLPREELDGVREQFKGNLLLSLESSDNRMTKLAKNELYFGRSIPLLEIMDAFDRITSDDILALAGELLDRRKSTLIMMGKPGMKVPAGLE